MFLSVLLRVYSARKINPELFKHITLIIDGQDYNIIIFLTLTFISSLVSIKSITNLNPII